MSEIKHFQEQNAEEKIIIVIRKHWIAYFKLLLIFSIIFIVPVLLIYLAFNNYFFDTISQRGLILTKVFFSLYFVYGLAFLIVAWIDEAFDLFILTNERLVDITQVNFFNRTVSTTPLNQIQDSTSHVGGVLETILGYGDVEVRTASGSKDTFFMDGIYDPEKVAHVILSETHKKREKGGGQLEIL